MAYLLCSIYKVHTANADDSNFVIMRKITVTSRRSVDYSDLEPGGDGSGAETASIVPVENPFMSSLERRLGGYMYNKLIIS